jgi:hypothetical protein
MAGLSSEDRAVEAALRDKLSRVRTGGTVCPSDAARAVAPDDWRRLMDPAREAARRLVAAGEAEITQGGKVVDLDTARGPIRVRPIRNRSG